MPTKAEQKSLAKDKGKLQEELAEVEHARHQVLGALAEAKNATRVAAKEEAKAAQQKLEDPKGLCFHVCSMVLPACGTILNHATMIYNE